MTFTIEDALISPMGLAVLSGAGLYNASKTNVKHVHCTIDATTVEGYIDPDATTQGIGDVVDTADGTHTKKVAYAQISLQDLRDELYLNDPDMISVMVCKSTAIPMYGTVLDNSGAGIDYIEKVDSYGNSSVDYEQALVVEDGQPLKLVCENSFANKTVKFDFYVIKNSGVSEIEIKANDFGGYFYLEAQTLFRREDTGEDMAAEIIIPKAKVQSAMTISLSASGDPSTYTFTLDAFPGYTLFDKTKKVMCVIQIVGDDDASLKKKDEHKHDPQDKYEWKLNATDYPVTVSQDDPASDSGTGYYYQSADSIMYYRKTTNDVWEESDVKIVEALPPVTFAGDTCYLVNETALRVVETK